MGCTEKVWVDEAVKSGGVDVQVYNRTHTKVDFSSIAITCNTGKCEYEWTRNVNPTRIGGGPLSELDSKSGEAGIAGWFLENHQLIVTTKQAGSKVTISFTGKDVC